MSILLALGVTARAREIPEPTRGEARIELGLRNNLVVLPDDIHQLIEQAFGVTEPAAVEFYAADLIFEVGASASPVVETFDAAGPCGGQFPPWSTRLSPSSATARSRASGSTAPRS